MGLSAGIWTIDSSGIVHMNGRVYDPAIGRFLSVDPVFQFPENTQSLNPYSYVLNSPLTATDPTGLSCESNPSECNKKSGGKTSNDEVSKKKDDKKKDDHKPNNTRDPRSAHLARANAKFEQPGITGSGTPTMRNLSNGIDTRQAAKKFDDLGKQLTDTIGQISDRAEALANQCTSIECRSDTYARWDKELRAKYGDKATVFFGAAAKVTGTFQIGAADTMTPDLYGSATEDFLSAANAHLFKFNAEIYIRLSTGADMGPLNGVTGENLDKALVAFEQVTLERFAATYFGRDYATQGRVYNNLSTALNATRWIGGPSYTQQAVALNWPKGNFDFGSLDNRIALGQAVMLLERVNR